MVKMNPPNSTATVDVRDADVDRYAEAGWTKVEADKETSKRTSRSSKR